jgi:hypothetical protein
MVRFPSLPGSAGPRFDKDAGINIDESRTSRRGLLPIFSDGCISTAQSDFINCQNTSAVAFTKNSLCIVPIKTLSLGFDLYEARLKSAAVVAGSSILTALYSQKKNTLSIIGGTECTFDTTAVALRTVTFTRTVSVYPGTLICLGWVALGGASRANGFASATGMEINNTKCLLNQTSLPREVDVLSLGNLAAGRIVPAVTYFTRYAAGLI